jgi:hypothetical protein
MTGQQGTAEIADLANCAVIVAHPDDETLWAGGTILMHHQARWKVVTLCRRSDPDRAPRFFQALDQLNATGQMGDLDDGPQQTPLDSDQVQNTILGLLALSQKSEVRSQKSENLSSVFCPLSSALEGFDLIITHGSRGEYTRHRRHEEVSKAVISLCQTGRLRASQIWQFAYEDGGGDYLPRPIQNADLKKKLPEKIWQKKYYIITNVYGFTADSFEAKTTPREEAFWCFSTNRRV